MQLPGAATKNSQIFTRASISNTDISLAREFQKNISEPTCARGLIDHVNTINEPVSVTGRIVIVMLSKAKIYNTNQFKYHVLQHNLKSFHFCGPHANPHGLRGSSKHYHLRLYPKLVHDKFAIIWTPCACISCKNMLDKIWVICNDPTRQPHYQPV